MQNVATTPRDTFEDTTVIVDTSVLLAMSQDDLMSRLRGATVVIPVIVVSELEGLRGSSRVGYFARQWLRTIESLRTTEGKSLAEGIEYRGATIILQMNNTSQDCLPNRLKNSSHDSVILAVAANTKENNPDKTVILASNDLPMRLSAALLLKIETAPLVVRSDADVNTWTGKVTLSLDSEHAATLNSIVSHGDVSEADEEHVRELVLKEAPGVTHALVELVVDGKDHLASLLMTPYSLTYVYTKMKCALEWVSPKSIEQRVAFEYLLESSDVLPLVSIGGGAGTGKTLLAVAAGLQEATAGNYKTVTILRSLHEMGKGQEMGFLPGGVEEKMGPWRGAIDDALDAIDGELNGTIYGYGNIDQILDVSPITYLRGRSLASSYVILEEAQNFSRSEILNVMSRLGKGSKLVMTFDDAQVDNRYLQSSSLADVWSVVNRMASEDLFAHITLVKTERSPAAELASRVLQDG